MLSAADHFHNSTLKERMATLLPHLLVAAAFWLFTRPYHGFWHDGIFYAVQALKNLHPAHYANDLFFLYGSQDDYTLYGKLQAALTAGLGMEQTLFWLAVAGGALWILALVSLLGRLFSGIWLGAAIIVALGLDAHYAGFGIFSFGEGFATPRVFSEAFVLFALAWWIGGRYVPAIAALAVAALLHPLVALAGVGVVAWSLLARYFRPAVLWPALLVLGLIGLQVLVWTGLSPWLDPEWKQLLLQRSPYVFPHMWRSDEWLRVLLDAALLILATQYLKGEGGKLAGWVLPVFALGMLYALAAGFMGVQLAVAAQIHRVQWLAHLLALAFALPLGAQLWQTENLWSRFLAGGVASSLVLPPEFGILMLPAMYLLCWLVMTRAPDIRLNRILTLLLLWWIPAIAMFNIATDLAFLLAREQSQPWLVMLRQVPVALLLLFVGHVLAKHMRREVLWLWIFGVFMLTAGEIRWSDKGGWNGYDQPARRAAIAPVQALIPENAVVYWESGEIGTSKWNNWFFKMGVGRTWFWLERSHYASINQAAGGLFYRQTAVEAARRMAHLRKWDFPDGNLDWGKRGKSVEKQELTIERLRGLCGDPVLNYVILEQSKAPARLDFQDPLSGLRFSVYDCAAIRAG